MDVFDGLLFDLDGALWDSVDAICISWNRALDRLAPEYAGTVTRARLLPCMGMLLPDILHRLVPELDQERMKPILEEVLVEENAYVAAHGGVLYPGVEQTLAALSALCFPLPMGSFEFGGPAEFLRPYLYDGIFYSADGLPSVLGPVLLFVSLCALAASLCQILRRDPYEE